MGVTKKAQKSLKVKTDQREQKKHVRNTGKKRAEDTYLTQKFGVHTFHTHFKVWKQTQMNFT